MSAVARLAIVVGLLLRCTVAIADCSKDGTWGGHHGVDKVYVHWVTANPPFEGAPLLGAMNSWNNSMCGGIDAIPTFQATATGANLTIPVTYSDDTHLNSCGQYFSGNHSITIYHRVLVGTQVFDCIPNSIKMTEQITHELGHFLGLGEANTTPQGCIYDAMAQSDPNVARSVHADECARADALNETSAEQPPGTPIVINLALGPYDLSGPDDTVGFDLDADGFVEQTTWTTQGANEAFLWLDRNDNGTVDNAGELFGNHTIRIDGSTASNGFEALRDFDTNGDGVIDSSDDIWPQLKLWTDLNHDGVSQPSEIQSVSTGGVVSISLSYYLSRRTDQYGNQFNFVSTVGLNRRGGVVFRPVYDITFVRIPN